MGALLVLNTFGGGVALLAGVMAGPMKTGRIAATRSASRSKTTPVYSCSSWTHPSTSLSKD